MDVGVRGLFGLDTFYIFGILYGGLEVYFFWVFEESVFERLR